MPILKGRKKLTECQTVNIAEAARILGVSYTTLQALINKGEIPVIPLGEKRKVILKETLEKILDQGRLK